MTRINGNVLRLHGYFLSLLVILMPLRLVSQEIETTDPQNRLMKDLLVVNYWNQRLNDKLPVYYDNWLRGGYLSMPSARMGSEGEVGIGYSCVPPYYSYNLRIQLVDFLEVTGNYRIFKGVEDPVLTKFGFGDFSDKGANVKLSIFHAETSHYKLPGVAIGLDDFLGTRAFRAHYIVLTQVFLQQNMEVSIGYGAHRIKRWFGGMSWIPFRQWCNPYLNNLSFTLEYDAIPYKDETYERHPKGRVKRTPLNIGLKYRLFDSVDLSLSYIRGDAVAFTVSSYYNFGKTKGLIPKIEDKLPYKSPVNNQEISWLRPENTMVQEFAYAMSQQGFGLMEGWLTLCNEKKILRLKVTNLVYREERVARDRLIALLVGLTPEDIDEVVIVIDGLATPIQQYRYKMKYVRSFREKDMGKYELNLLTPMQEATETNEYSSQLIYKVEKDRFNIEVMPKTQTLFGSSGGKFKYALGLSVNINGFIWDDVYYTLSLGYFIFSDLHGVKDYDRLNPSQIINVRSDVIKYYRQRAVTIDQAFVEKIWNWRKGWYTKISIGLFEQEYGGTAVEWLYYPVNCPWAVGMDFAVVKKRSPHGVDFTNRIRKLDHYRPTYRKFIGSQYFLNIYYDWKSTGLELKSSVGKFLADDFGIKTEISRYFPSGLKIGFWYTYTNGNDHINSQVYHDKGVYFSMPLDIFYTHSSRSRWGYGMSAWLRDVGVSAYTGNKLYDLINQYRQ